MANEGLALTYARAVFEEAMMQWLNPLKTVAASLKPEVIAKLDDNALAFSKKQELLRPLLPSNTPKPVENFIFLLASKGDVHLLNQVINDLDRYAKREAFGVTAKVTSAITLTDGEKSAIESKMRAQFGKDLAFDYVVDPAILGGVVVRVGDKVIDGSVAGKLAALQEKLK
ncbi:MAG: ATP synthase F1 subunit delta [Chloroflexi bacterium]|nr:ATP synthase F1 subunit delta [Chloroflexota bacterium]